MSKMIDVRPFFLHISIISIAVYYFLRLLKKATYVGALLNPPPPTPPSPLPPTPPSPRWFCHAKEETPCNAQQPEFFMPITGICNALKGSNFSTVNAPVDGGIRSMRKRPAQLVIPTCLEGIDFVEKVKKVDYVKEIEGRDFVLVSKKGRREAMEDRHAVVLDISSDPKQAFFAVIDGHGGNAAADYVAENLGKNVLNEFKGVGRAGNQIEAALRRGYSATDKQFLARDVNSGACAASVLLKDGELHASNVGDCKVVLSRKGKAITLTSDHRLSREDERARIENSGGFLHCHNGVWRVNGSLAVSRAFGDLYLKDWIICEPEIVRVPLTTECEFLIVASDGLWDKVSDQEAIDVVSNKRNLDSCRKLVDISSSRGNRDDITVMMINLQNFKNSDA